jgi:hypothetical protein
MASTIVLQDRFDRGMIRDLPIDQLPAGALWNQIDMIPGSKAGLSMRGTWTQFSNTISGTYGSAVGFAPFAAGAQVVAINDSAALKSMPASTGIVTDRGTVQIPFMPPTFYREMVYIPSNNGTTSVKSYNGSTNAGAASGSPPAGMFATVFKDHLVLARNAATPNRMWFSNGGDGGTWDTAADGQWLDLTYVPNGITSLRNMILAFSENAVERVRGDIIPGVAGSDMVKELMFNVGCPDPASIAPSDDYVVFANPNGVYMTDGIGLVDLTDQCGIKSYYRTVATSGLITYAGGLYQGHYILSILDANGVFVDSMCFDIAKRRAWRFTNVRTLMMVQAPTSASALSGELFFVERGRTYVSRLGPMFKPPGDAAGDGDLTYPSPSVQTGYLRGKQGKKRWKKLYFSYHLKDPASTNPTVNVSWNLNATLGDTPGSTTIAETSATAAVTPRTPVAITGNQPSDGISVTVSGTNTATNELRLFLIEAEVRPQEQSK